MFLSIKEMEVRKVRFDETFLPGQIDFPDTGVTQAGPLHVAGVAELLANSGGEVRLRGDLTVTMGAECDRCLAAAQFPVAAKLDLFYRPMSTIARDEEVEIDE